MFEALGQRFGKIFSGLSGKVTESELENFISEIRLALLDSDVALEVAEEFSNRIFSKVKALESEINKSTNPAQRIFEIVNQELTKILGGSARRLKFAKSPPTVILLTGLQGAGKTSLAGKLAHYLSQQSHTPLLVAADLQRPNAVNQLQIVGKSINIPVFAPEPGNGIGDPIQVASAGLQFAKDKLHNFVIIDTAGRTGIDEELMQEVIKIRDSVKPDEIFFVVDAMTGQDAARTAKAFSEGVGFDAVVLTKLDGDARGGAALSIVELTGKPIIFAATGENTADFDLFYPERMASMGSMNKLLGLLPGSAGMKKQLQNFDETELVRTRAIIESMTPLERNDPKVLNGSRRARIAKGSGRAVSEINSLVERFTQAQKVMKQMRSGSIPPALAGAGSMGTMPKTNQVSQKPKKKSRSGNPAKRAIEEGI